jgi:hypothetical protein
MLYVPREGAGKQGQRDENKKGNHPIAMEKSRGTMECGRKRHHMRQPGQTLDVAFGSYLPFFSGLLFDCCSSDVRVTPITSKTSLNRVGFADVQVEA